MKEYRNGVTVIDSALSTPVELPEATDDTWEDACKKIHKMKRTRGELIQRITTLSANIHKVNTQVDKQSAEGEQQNIIKRPRTYTELARALQNMNGEDVASINVLELLFSCDGVKMYHIERNGDVTSSNEDSTFRIVKIEGDDNKNLDSTVFLQVIPTANAERIEDAEEPFEEISEKDLHDNIDTNLTTNNHKNEEVDVTTVEVEDPSWIYPLVVGVSPCYRTEYGAFIVPDLKSETGAAVGFVIPKDADDVVLEILVAILGGIVNRNGIIEIGDLSQMREKQAISTTVSANIVKGAYFVSENLVKGAEKAGQFFNYSTPYLISKLSKAPADAPPVSDKVRNSLEIAKNVTGTAASVTGYCANKVGSATMALGRFLAPHIQKHGSKLLSHSLGISQEDASDHVTGVLTICAGAVEGLGTVYTGLETSAIILGRNISNNTVQVVEHKYGPSASSAVGSTLDTVGNVINVSQNVNGITPKGLVKRTAKNAGKALVANYTPNVASSSTSIVAGSIYPDLSELAKEISKKNEITIEK